MNKKSKLYKMLRMITRAMNFDFTHQFFLPLWPSSLRFLPHSCPSFCFMSLMRLLPHFLFTLFIFAYGSFFRSFDNSECYAVIYMGIFFDMKFIITSVRDYTHHFYWLSERWVVEFFFLEFAIKIAGADILISALVVSSVKDIKVQTINDAFMSLHLDV